MQPHQTDIQATASGPTPSRARTEGERSLGPEQACRYLGLHRREFAYLVEAGLLVPIGRSSAGTLRFAVSALDAVAGQPLDWAAARSAEARCPSPWRELAGSASERARLVDDVTAALRAAGVDAWARHSMAEDRWTLDWAPAHGGGPGRGEVTALLPPRLVRAVDAQRLVLLGPVGQTMHWAHDMLQPGVACVLDVETTGLSPADRVIEVAAVDAHDGSVLIDTLVHPGPGITIPAGATRVHGITNSMVADARPWSVVLPEVLAAVGSRVLLAYNSEFDRRMSVGHARALGADPGRLHSVRTWQCLMKRRSMWLGTTTRLRLGGRHCALGDAAAARDLLLSLRERPPHTLPAPQPDRIARVSRRCTTMSTGTDARGAHEPAPVRNPPAVRVRLRDPHGHVPSLLRLRTGSLARGSRPLARGPPEVLPRRPGTRTRGRRPLLPDEAPDDPLPPDRPFTAHRTPHTAQELPMSETTAQSRPGTTAFTLLRMTAQGEAAHHAAGGEGPPPADMEMYGALTAALETWRGVGRLRPQALVLIEWLATEYAGYRTQLLGQDQDAFASWLRAFGDEVSLTQRHPHPAGPTCVELLTVVASAPPGERPEERAARLAVPFLSYLRPGSELEDAREIALSFALWAGQDLAALMQYDAERIAGYTQARAS